MEFRPQDVAQLVLGYLKDERCHSAFCEFINNCDHLKDHALSHSRGKYFITRVAGLSLVDYLNEYAVIYTIVQERLEASEYYTENRSRTTLVKQLLYLLENDGIESRTSTPIRDRRFQSSPEKTTRKKSSQRELVQDVPETSRNNSFERLSMEVNTTLPSSLPGNSSTDLTCNNSSKRKSCDKSTCTEDDLEIKEKSQEKLEIFTQTLLGNSDFIEKLTENINKEVSSKSSSVLDSSVIQHIVQQTEEDPVFVQLFEELMGTIDDEEDPNNSSPHKGIEGQEQELHVPHVPIPPSTPKKTPDSISTSNCLKQRLRSSKKLNASPSKLSHSIEEQNNDAVESIIAAALTHEIQPVEAESNCSSSTPNNQVEVVGSSGAYSNSIQTSVTDTSVQNHMFTNTSGLLMLQPNATTLPCSSIATRNLQVEPPKPCYIIGNQPFVNVNVPQTPFKMLTEQDILTMPTIFVCDNNQQPASSQAVIVSQAVSAPTTTSLGQNRLFNIAPKATPEKAQTLSEYITLYQCNDSFTSVVQQPHVQPSPRKSKAKLKHTASSSTQTKKTKKNQHHTSVSAKDENIAQPVQNFSSCSSSLVQIASTVENTLTDKEAIPQKSDENKHVTPKAKVGDRTEILSRSTPRSGSHVRKLVFGTPDKCGPTLRRSATSPKIEKHQAIKTSSNKMIRTTLFKSPDLEVPTNVADPSTSITEKRNIRESDADPAKTSEVPDASSGQVGTSNTNTVATSWDADLRALAGPSVPTKTVSQKQKRKRVEESPKQNGNSKKLRESASNHNKTEDDALKIELALSSVLSEMETSNVGAENVSASAKDIAKPKNKRRDRPATKKAGSAKRAGKGSTDKQPSEKVAEIASVPAADKLCAISVNVDAGVMDIAEHSKKCVNDQSYLEKPYAVINRNMKPRIRKKCNMENAVKKTPASEEIVLTNVTRIKSCEIIDDGQNTLILSPSKLNANKRSLVEIDNRNVVEQHIVAKNINTDTKTEETTDGKLTTPEFVKTSTNNPLLAAKRNILPVLETPVKFDPLPFPKTPGIANTSIIDTPFTKAVIEQLSGVDINAIPTPKFPITPNFPFTPAYDQSPFSNRGTDYSTSSSYYQPSDTEQNKSLEQLIEECRRLENQPASHKSIKNAADNNQTCTESSKAQEKLDEGLVSPNKNVQKSQNLESTKKVEGNSARPGESSQHIKKILSDKEKAFNQSIIGKKNLHLVKMLSDDAEEEKDSSESSSTESDSSSSSSDDSDSSNCSFADDVDAIKSNGRNSSPYSLRPRKSLVATNLNASNEKDTSTEKVKPSESSASKSPVEKSTKPPFKDGLLKEMEQIRQRTIAKFKDANSSVKKPDNSKKKKPTPKPKKIESRIVKPLPQKVQPLKPIKPDKSIKGGAGSSNLSKVDKSTLDKVPVSSIKQQRPKSDSPKKTAKNIKQEISSLKKENVIASNLNFKSNKKLEHLKTSKSELTLKKAGASEIPTFSRKISQSDTKLELLKQSQHPVQAEEQIKSPNINRRNSDGSAMNYETAKPLETLPEISKSTKSKSPTKLLSPKKPKQSGRSPELQPQIAYVTIKDPTAMLDEEEDFILHLSSDEENLEPFEMVETELLECSTSSTPISDENRVKQIPDSPKEKSSEEKTQEMIDQEQDCLVKGLKSWGIHLVPNKSVKKTTIPPESTETIFSGRKVDDQQQTEDSCNKTPKTTEKHTVSVEKPPKKLNQSIEEGELVSDDESGPKKDIKKDKKKPHDTRKPYLQKATHSRRDSDPSRERRNQNQQKNSSEAQRSRPYLESVAKSATTSRNALPSKPCSSDKKSVPNKNAKIPEKADKAKTQTTVDNEKSGPNKNFKILEKADPAKTQTTDDKSKDKPATVVVAEKEIITNELDYQVEFDVKTYDQETFSIVHDESKKSTRKITDYNFDILTKKFSANVYIAEIDSEVEKILLFSPFRFLLDIPSKLSTLTSQKSTSSQIQIKKKSNPLKILYNQLIKSSEDRQQSSPLDDLYAPESSTRENRKSKEESNKRNSERRLSIEKIDKSDKLEKSKSKPKSLVKETTTTKEPCPSKDEPKISDGISDQEKVKNEVTTTENLKETESSKSSSLDKTKNTTESTSGLEVVDGVIMLNSNAENTPYDQSDDELMNYAVIGSERVKDDESLITDKKRKTTEEADEGKNQEKKQKTEVCQELLRNIDVDSFLKKLHGET